MKTIPNSTFETINFFVQAGAVVAPNTIAAQTTFNLPFLNAKLVFVRRLSVKTLVPATFAGAVQLPVFGKLSLLSNPPATGWARFTNARNVANVLGAVVPFNSLDANTNCDFVGCVQLTNPNQSYLMQLSFDPTGLAAGHQIGFSVSMQFEVQGETSDK